MPNSRAEVKRWSAYLRLALPYLRKPDTFGGKYTWDELRLRYGNWLPIILMIDGPSVAASRLVKMGIICPMDCTSPF